VVKFTIFSALLLTTLQASKNPIPRDKEAAIAQAKELKAEVDEKNRELKELYRQRASSVVSNFDFEVAEDIEEFKPTIELLKKIPIVSNLTDEDFKFIKKDMPKLPHIPLKLPDSEKGRYEKGVGHVK
jgi:oligoribonuclease (3'-5' exoribonuclease)